MNLRKSTAALLSLVLLLGLGTTACAAPAQQVENPSGYADVTPGDWFYDAVTYCQQQGLMTGTSPTHFDPQGSMTRAMLSTALYRQAGSPAVSGKAGNRFDPQGTATRAEVAAILRNLATNSTPDPAEGKVLIAYFSCTNNTANIAQHIQAALPGATLYQITPAQPYTAADLNYSNDDCRANREQQDPAARPALAGQVENLAEYDVVFLGYPIWWGQPPKIIYSFLEAHDLQGKTVVPFCTSGGSGYSDAGIRDIPQEANWVTGQRFSGGASQSSVQAWVEGLDLPTTPETPSTEEGTNLMTIEANGSTWTATLVENSSTAALKERLGQGPLTLSMEDYNSMEKVGPLGFDLPTNDEPIDAQTGDLILYQGNQLVLYYGTNHWNFTRLGKLNGVSREEMLQVLGRGDVEITLRLGAPS